MDADAAYQGAQGAFSEDAARALLGPDVRLWPCRTLVDVFEALATGRVAAAVVPVVNSIVGPVPDAADLLAHHQVHIVAEHTQPIDQAVIGLHAARLQDLRRIWSHPVALAQCTRWFARYPHVTATPTFDTAGAVAEIIRRGDPADAAMASRRTAEVYGGQVLADRVQDRADNTTRFVLVRRGRSTA